MGYPTHVLKSKADKLEQKSKVYLGYSKRTKGYYFYSQVY